MAHSYKINVRRHGVALVAAAGHVLITGQPANLTFNSSASLTAGTGSVPIRDTGTTNLILTTPFSGTEFATVTVTSLTTGPIQYEGGIYPLPGEVPAGYVLVSSDDVNLRSSTIATHADGSASVMVFSGEMTYAAPMSKFVAIRAAASSSGTNLTVAKITSLVTSMSVNFPGFGGSVSVNLAAPERVWWTNPSAIVATYRVAAPTPGSTALEAVICIHAYSARALVEVVVENGKVTIGNATGPANAVYTGITYTVNGSTSAPVNSPTARTDPRLDPSFRLYNANAHQQFRAWYASTWVGGDPQAQVTHDTSYMQRHALFPLIDQPTDQDTQHVDQNGLGYVPGTMAYVPWTIAEQRPSMAAPGDDVTLGLFPRWQMQYIQTGSRASANEVLVNDLAALSYPISYRDNTTGAIPTFDQCLAAGVFRGNGAGGLPMLPASSSTPDGFPYWEEEHPPATGLISFLLRPSPVFIELAQKAAFFHLTYSQPDQTSKFWSGRNKAWGLRAATHAAFLTPTQMPAGGSRATSEVTTWRSAARDAIGRNVATHHTSYIASPLRSNPLQVMYTGTPGPTATVPTTDEAWDEDAGIGGFEQSIWQHFWLASVLHHIDKSGVMSGHTQAARLSAWADWALQTPAKVINESAAGEWRYQEKLTTIGSVGHASSTSTDVGDPGIYPDFATAYAAAKGSPPAASGTFNYLFGEIHSDYVTGWDPETGPRTMANSYAIIMVEALGHAKERGLGSASTAWNTVLANITNWSTWRSGMRTDPRACHYPRTVTGTSYSNPNWPTWRRAMVPGTWAKIGTTPNSIDPKDNPNLNPPAFYNASPRTDPWTNISPGIATEGFQAMIDDWSGAAFNEADDTLNIIGGGHNGYAGNPVISCNLRADSPVWRIERPPTGSLDPLGGANNLGTGINLNDGQEVTFQYSNGDPRSAHTYNLMCWVGNALYHMPAAIFQNPSAENTGAHKIFKFVKGSDPDNFHYGTQTFVTSLPAGTYPGLAWYGSMSYDAKRNRLQVCPFDFRPIQLFDLNTLTFSASADFAGATYNRAIRIEPLDITVYLSNFNAAGFTVYDPTSNHIFAPPHTGTPPDPTGMSTLQQGGTVVITSHVAEQHASGVWCQTLGCILRRTRGGTGFDTLTPPASGSLTSGSWAWGRLEASAVNTVTPDLPTEDGTYGRLFYSPWLHVVGFISLTSRQLNVFALP